MRYFRRYSCAAALLAFLARGPVASSQTLDNWIGGTGAWDAPANWSTSFPPDSTFDEVGNISNGGTAQVNAPVATPPGRVVLGRLAGETGTLVVGNGGQITALSVPGNQSNGEFQVGASGVGLMTVQPGGSITGNSLNVGGAVGSKLTVGAATGGVATVSISQNPNSNTSVSRELRVVGPNVNFATGSMNLQSTGVFVPQITSATAHSPIKVTNVFDIAGGAVLRPEFNGVTPTAGNKWNLFDASAIFGSFTIDKSAAPALSYGQIFQFVQKPDVTSVNGVFGQLTVEQRLVLDVNRTSGAVSINTGTVPISIDGYSIRSTLGALKPSGWTSLQDQAVSDWRESPPNGSTFALSELKPTGSTSITSVTSRSMGTAYQAVTPTQFGTELEDVTFEYYSAGGVVTQGIVNYIGTKQFNNLVLVVDPATGKARMENESILSVNIDGYKIDSASGSLKPADGQWNSLDDQNVAGGDWRESNPTVNHLVELKPTTSAAMTGGSNFGYNLGSLFKTISAGGTQDLTFQYLFPGDQTFRDGVVVYRTLPAFLAADFNHDSLVNAADLVLWKAAFGVGAGGDANGDGLTDGADLKIWQNQLGQLPATVVAAAAPEPASIALAVIGLTALAVRRRVA